MQEFNRIRGNKADDRCKNANSEYGSPLYCECGCQKPQESDHDYNLDGLSAKFVKSSEVYVGLVRDGKIVGSIDAARDYISLDGNEYMGVVAGSRLARLFDLPIEGEYPPEIITSGSTAQETIAQVATAEKISIAEMDAKNESHPGYCRKCHSFCYGDCEAN